MDDTLRFESQRLKFSWDKNSHDHLDTYLVQDVEDPRINAQSILTRALIADTLFPGRFTVLIDAEFQFSACMIWILKQLRDGHSRWDLLNELEQQKSEHLPEFICAMYRALQCDESPYPNFISDALFHAPVYENFLIHDRVLSTFASFWNSALKGLSAEALRILEPGCGSANDYRQLDQHGLSRFLNYTGIDIASKNIENACLRYPNVDFAEGNIFEIAHDDGAFAYSFVHDLFEHLSPDGFEIAVREMLRVTRNEAWFAFFDLQDIPDHIIQPMDDYHINTLSLGKTVKLIEQTGARVDVIDVALLMRQKTLIPDYYNPHAKTLIVSKE